MKIRDLFIDHYEIDGLRIIRILNLELFFAISSNDRVPGKLVIHFFDNDVVEYCYDTGIISLEKSYFPTKEHALKHGKRLGKAPYLVNRNKLPANVAIVTFLTVDEVIAFKNKDLPIEKIYQKAWMTLDSIEYLLQPSLDRFVCEGQEKIEKDSNNYQHHDATITDWYKVNAKEENPIVLFNLGVLYADGRGVAPDNFKAVSLYKKAADVGCVEAMGILSSMYKYGRGIELNPAKAEYWFNKVIETNDLTSWFILGEYHARGIGVAQNDIMAMYWYKRSARKGNKEAMYAISSLYRYGRGVTKSWLKEKYWLIKSGRLSWDKKAIQQNKDAIH